jgi:hypothetical protein
MTWITPICSKSKAIIREIDAGEELAMLGDRANEYQPRHQTEEAMSRALRAQIPPRRPSVKGHGAKYGRKREAAIAALLTSKNHEEAARAIDVDLKTLKRWMRLPEFIEEYRRARWEVVEQAYARVQQNTGAAGAVLLKLMADPATPSSSRIRAAMGVFGLARESLDFDIETRVAALEAEAASGKHRR